MKYGYIFYTKLQYKVQETVGGKRGLSTLLLVTLILHNPLDQHSHNALLQPVSY